MTGAPLKRSLPLVEAEISEAVETLNQAGNPWLPLTEDGKGQTYRYQSSAETDNINARTEMSEKCGLRLTNRN